MSTKSIAVIGGGIGGVSAALNLLRAGFDVHVYEQSRALREVGAGINVTPNAARVIHGLGLGDKLASLGVMPMAVHQQRWDDGRTLLRTPLGMEIERHFGFRQYQSHRADAQHVGSSAATRTHACRSPLDWFSERRQIETQPRTEHGHRSRLIGLTASTTVRELFGATPPRFAGLRRLSRLVPAEKITSRSRSGN
jgi:salicylate hydroxylase